MSVESPLAGITVTRTYTLSQKELHEVLSWNPSMENHPLLDLEKMLEVKYCKIYCVPFV